MFYLLGNIKSISYNPITPRAVITFAQACVYEGKKREKRVLVVELVG